MPSVKAARAIAESLFRLYGPEVEVRYFDLGDPAVKLEQAGSLEEIAAARLPLPVLMLDEELLFAGTIVPLRVVATVAAEMRARRKSVVE